MNKPNVQGLIFLWHADRDLVLLLEVQVALRFHPVFLLDHFVDCHVAAAAQSYELSLHLSGVGWVIGLDSVGQLDVVRVEL